MTLFFVAATVLAMSAQVDKVSYSLEYNAEQCMFDVFLNVEAGKTKNTMHRVQLNSQISVVAPANTNINVEENFMPLVDNQTKQSDEAASWEVTSMLNAPEVTEHLSYHSITPYLNPAAFYGDLRAGDKVKLFTFSVEPFVNCAADVRLFDNESDPKSIDNGMRGANFENGFTIGAIHQSYIGNNEKVGPEAPIINTLHQKGREMIMDVEYNAVSSCQGQLNFEWKKGNQTIKTGPQAPSLTNSQIRTGDYKLVLTDGLGCTTEKVITIYGDNNIGGQNSGLTADNGNIVVASENATAQEQEHLSNAASQEVETAVSMFPNPAKDYVNIDVAATPGKAVVANIVDAAGKVVKANVINTQMAGSEQSFRVVISDLGTGLFNVNVTVGGEPATSKKLIIIE